MHGYRLNEFIERNLAFCTDVKKSSVLPARPAAEEGHLVEAERTLATGARRARCAHHAAGEEHFRTLLCENPPHERPTFL